MRLLDVCADGHRRQCVMRWTLMLLVVAAASHASVGEAGGYRRSGGRRTYGSNYGYSYSTPRFRYYNGPGGYGGGNVQYFQRGNTGFWVGSGYDANGRLRTNSGFFYFR